MAKKPARASDGSRAGINDDIGEEMRLTMYRMQVEIREGEQRAFDLFLQNLVKGTSHLSLGQEAIAAGFATATMIASFLHQHLASTPEVVERFVATAVEQGTAAPR